MKKNYNKNLQIVSQYHNLKKNHVHELFFFYNYRKKIYKKKTYFCFFLFFFVFLLKKWKNLYHNFKRYNFLKLFDFFQTIFLKKINFLKKYISKSLFFLNKYFFLIKLLDKIIKFFLLIFIFFKKLFNKIKKSFDVILIQKFYFLFKYRIHKKKHIFHSFLILILNKIQLHDFILKKFFTVFFFINNIKTIVCKKKNIIFQTSIYYINSRYKTLYLVFYFFQNIFVQIRYKCAKFYRRLHNFYILIKIYFNFCFFCFYFSKKIYIFYQNVLLFCKIQLFKKNKCFCFFKLFFNIISKKYLLFQKLLNYKKNTLSVINLFFCKIKKYYKLKKYLFFKKTTSFVFFCGFGDLNFFISSFKCSLFFSINFILIFRLYDVQIELYITWFNTIILKSNHIKYMFFLIFQCIIVFHDFFISNCFSFDDIFNIKRKTIRYKKNNSILKNLFLKKKKKKLKFEKKIYEIKNMETDFFEMLKKNK